MPRLLEALGGRCCEPREKNSAMSIPLVTEADGVIRVAGTRVTLDTVIDTFLTDA